MAEGFGLSKYLDVRFFPARDFEIVSWTGLVLFTSSSEEVFWFVPTLVLRASAQYVSGQQLPIVPMGLQ